MIAMSSADRANSIAARCDGVEAVGPASGLRLAKPRLAALLIGRIEVAQDDLPQLGQAAARPG